MSKFSDRLKELTSSVKKSATDKFNQVSKSNQDVKSKVEGFFKDDKNSDASPSIAETLSVILNTAQELTKPAVDYFKNISNNKTDYSSITDVDVFNFFDSNYHVSNEKVNTSYIQLKNGEKATITSFPLKNSWALITEEKITECNSIEDLVKNILAANLDKKHFEDEEGLNHLLQSETQNILNVILDKIDYKASLTPSAFAVKHMLSYHIDKLKDPNFNPDMLNLNEFNFDLTLNDFIKDLHSIEPEKIYKNYVDILLLSSELVDNIDSLPKNEHLNSNLEILSKLNSLYLINKPFDDKNSLNNFVGQILDKGVEFYKNDVKSRFNSILSNFKQTVEKGNPESNYSDEYSKVFSDSVKQPEVNSTTKVDDNKPVKETESKKTVAKKAAVKKSAAKKAVKKSVKKTTPSSAELNTETKPAATKRARKKI